MTEKTKATIEDRLLLRSARVLEFWGFVDGCGFAVRVDLDIPDVEFSGLVRHWGDLYAFPTPGVGASLLLRDNEAEGDDYVWAAWQIGIKGSPSYDAERYSPVSIEDDREATTLALDICDGRVRPAELSL